VAGYGERGLSCRPALAAGDTTFHVKRQPSLGAPLSHCLRPLTLVVTELALDTAHLKSKPQPLGYGPEGARPIEPHSEAGGRSLPNDRVRRVAASQFRKGRRIAGGSRGENSGVSPPAGSKGSAAE
jgi:hypothetical protein